MKVLHLFVLFILINAQAYSQSILFSSADLEKITPYYSLPDSNYENVYKVSIQNIGTIPADITKYKNLQCFETFGNDWDNQLDTIPESFYDLKNLTLVSFANANIKTISPSVSKLKNLRELWIGQTLVSSLPASLSMVNTLRILSVDNTITKIPALPQLEDFRFTFYGQDTSFAYPEIKEMRNLKTLTIDGYGILGIKDLSAKLANLKMLEEITFRGSYIMPESDFMELSKLTQVKKIRIKEFQEMPAYINKYKQVELVQF